MKEQHTVLSVALAIALIAASSLDAQKWVKFEGTSAAGGKMQLAGILTVPPGKGSFPAVVMLCGCAGLKNQDDQVLQQSWADRFAGFGYVTLQVDSFGPRGYDNGVCEGGDEVNNLLRAKDAFAGKTYLAHLKFVDAGRMAVAGWSHGGWAVMAAVDANNRDKGDEPFQAAVALYPWCVASYKRDTPLLILIGAKDDIFSSTQCQGRYDKTLNDVKYEQIVRVYPNATHAFDIEKFTKDYGHPMRYDPQATADAIIQTRDFLAKYLKAPGGAE
jgi:dienelactone hydrolase